MCCRRCGLDSRNRTRVYSNGCWSCVRHADPVRTRCGAVEPRRSELMLPPRPSKRSDSEASEKAAHKRPIANRIEFITISKHNPQTHPNPSATPSAASSNWCSASPDRWRPCAAAPQRRHDNCRSWPAASDRPVASPWRSAPPGSRRTGGRCRRAPG